jgi:hypothetical protein
MTATWIVLLMGSRNPSDLDRALSIVQADTAEEALRAAHTRPPSTLTVRHAWVHRLAEPYSPTLFPADVPKPEWAQATSQERKL